MRARVHQHEAARAVGVLRLAGLEAGLADERRLLVAQDAGDRHAAQRGDLRRAVARARRHDARQQRARHVERREQLVVPIERVSNRRAACGSRSSRPSSARRRRGRPSGSRAPTSRSCRTARRRAAALARAPGTLSSSHLSFRPLKYVASGKPRACAKSVLAAVARVGGHEVGRPRVLPDERVAQSGAPVLRSHSTVVSR